MTAPLTPAQLDGIRADLRYVSRVRSMLPGRRARVAIALSEADTARALLVEVDRLRDYANTIDATNADLVRANEVHRQRIRDVLAECDRADAPGHRDRIRRAAGVGQPTQSVPGTTERLLMAHRLVGGSRCACGWDAIQAHAEHEWHLEAVLDLAGLLR